MSGLDAVDVRVERPDGLAIGYARPLLHEIRQTLHRLSSSGEAATNELSFFPLPHGGRHPLSAVAGESEIQAPVHVLGPSRGRETVSSGAWRAPHMNSYDEELSALILIARLPFVPVTPEAHVEDSAVAPGSRLSA